MSKLENVHIYGQGTSPFGAADTVVIESPEYRIRITLPGHPAQEVAALLWGATFEVESLEP